jgi:DeoR/GlpR family transcriptional regulator of sugar metabolism
MHKVASQVLIKQERQEFIMKQLNLHNKVLSADLCNELSVSEDTIRRDLNELSDLGKIVKVHGGALSKSYSDFGSENEVYAFQEKQIIAEKTLKLIKNGMFVLVGGGTTVREILRRIPQNIDVTFFTVSLSAALELVQKPNCEVIFIGGKISKSTKFSTGGETIMRLSEIKADLCIFGTNAIDESGIMEFDNEVVQVKKAMIRAADKTAVVTIAEKLGSTQRLRVCEMKEVDYLITEKKPSENIFDNYKKMGVEVM